ncbi:EamA family transporter [Sinorhizobium sp. BG8]|uniref:EamA family transporter n=1 Tax=Sinorhizobium sp. BG8 TaxID=2613773 RepID=UPI00193D79A2|nr:EamA family transporter [Sinorhizobium sp. BG8]QRM54629.1 EamA family transporter [Sinorhizobium sp. BG8]
MKSLLSTWQFWALGSAVFAALTAILAKAGIGDTNADFATFVRTVVILLLLACIVTVTQSWQSPSAVSPRSWIFLVLSGLATGASWFCYFRALKLGNAAQVAPLDKLSVVLVAIFAVLFLGERLSPTHWLAVSMIAAGAVLLTLRI